MKNLSILFFLCILGNNLSAQATRVAILDFENISGIAKYDGLGKAMSSMLISDIEANVSPKRLQLVERAQIQKVLKEQNFQATGSVNKSTAVKAGKILGVGYLLVGDVYILNDQLIINARLTNTETGDIVFSKKQEGKTVGWLTLKTNIAKDLATSLAQPFTEPNIPDKETSVATITSFGNAVAAKDNGDFGKAENLIETVHEFNPDFKYLDDLSDEIEKLKKQMKILQDEVETAVENPVETANNFIQKEDYLKAIKYFQIGLNRIPSSEFGSKYAYFIFLSEAYFKNKEYLKAIAYSDSVLAINSYEPKAFFTKSNALSKINRGDDAIRLLNFLFENKDSIGSASVFLNRIYSYSLKNKNVIFDKLKIEHTSGSITFNKKIQYSSFVEFEKEYHHLMSYQIFELNSGGYEFSQRLDFDEFIYFYTSIMKSNNIIADKIAKAIENLKIIDSIDLFKSYTGDHTIANIRIGNIKDTGEYVIAKTGNAYKGSAHFIGDFLPNVGKGMYSDKSNRGMLGGGFFECPCDLLILKTVFLELLKNKGSININNRDHCSQIFSSGWYNILARNYSKSIDQYLSVIKYYIKLTQSLNGYNLNGKDFDFYRMSIINLGHSYMLSGKFDMANEFYTNKILSKDFSESFGNLSKAEVIKMDWNDFIENSIVNKEFIIKFNNKYKIVESF